MPASTRIVATLIAFTLPAQAAAQSCGGQAFLGGKMTNVYDLNMLTPKVSAPQMLISDGWAEKGDILVRQVAHISPVKRYLAEDAQFDLAATGELPKALPLTKGAMITSWSNEEETRHCTIGWKNGLFGGATGDGHYRWVCFQDLDGDGAFENAWRTKSKNLGLSYKRVEMPLLTPVRYSDAAPTGDDALKDQLGALGSSEFSRSVTVRRIRDDDVEIRLFGFGDKLDVTMPKTVGAKTSLAGLDLEIVGVEKKRVHLKVTGELAPVRVTELCGGTFHSVGDLETKTVFSFPNW